MDSVWNSLYDHPVPVNRLSAIVGFGAGDRPVEGEMPNIDGYEKYTKAPPENLVDNRGRRSFYHMVVGFSHRVKQRGVSSPSRDRFKVENGLKTGARYTYSYKSVWYVMRADGKINLVNGKKLRAKLKKLDEGYIKRVKAGELPSEPSAQWLQVCDIPIGEFPCVQDKF